MNNSGLKENVDSNQKNPTVSIIKFSRILEEAPRKKDNLESISFKKNLLIPWKIGAVVRIDERARREFAKDIMLYSEEPKTLYVMRVRTSVPLKKNI